jgi:hypothetical protein
MNAGKKHPRIGRSATFERLQINPNIPLSKCANQKVKLGAEFLTKSLFFTLRNTSHQHA